MSEFKLSRTVSKRVAINLATLLHFIEGLVVFCDDGATGTSSGDHLRVRITLNSDSVEFKDTVEFGTFVRAFPEWQQPNSISVSAHHMGQPKNHRYVSVDFDPDRVRVYVSGDDLFWTHQAVPKLTDQIHTYVIPKGQYMLRNWLPLVLLPAVFLSLVMLAVHPFVAFMISLVWLASSGIWLTTPASSSVKKRWNPRNILLLR